MYKFRIFDCELDGSYHVFSYRKKTPDNGVNLKIQKFLWRFRKALDFGKHCSVIGKHVCKKLALIDTVMEEDNLVEKEFFDLEYPDESILKSVFGILR